MGFSFVPISIAALAGVKPSEAGLASGLINTSQQVGGALGIAALRRSRPRRRPTRSPPAPAQATALTDGFQAAFIGRRRRRRSSASWSRSSWSAGATSRPRPRRSRPASSRRSRPHMVGSAARVSQLSCGCGCLAVHAEGEQCWWHGPLLWVSSGAADVQQAAAGVVEPAVLPCGTPAGRASPAAGRAAPPRPPARAAAGRSLHAIFTGCDPCADRPACARARLREPAPRAAGPTLPVSAG